jgi:hypothetical protein
MNGNSTNILRDFTNFYIKKDKKIIDIENINTPFSLYNQRLQKKIVKKDEIDYSNYQNAGRKWLEK